MSSASLVSKGGEMGKGGPLHSLRGEGGGGEAEGGLQPGEGDCHYSIILPLNITIIRVLLLLLSYY